MSSAKSLFHYTSASGLAGIFSSKTVWLTHILALNDSLEETHAISLLADYLASRHGMVSAEAKKYEQDFDPEINDDPLETSGFHNELSMLNQLKVSFQNESRYSGSEVHFRNSSTFTFSLSQDQDSLSQWRAYSKDGGYAIEFSYDLLKECCKSNGAELVECVYDIEQQKKIIKEVLDPYFDNKSKQGRHQNYCISNYDSILITILKLTRTIRARFKNSSFSEEKEWRIVLFRDHLNRKNFPLVYRTNNAYLVPYVELQIDFAVNSIIVGPSIDFNRAKAALNILCEDDNDKLLQCSKHRIRKSKSSFRI